MPIIFLNLNFLIFRSFLYTICIFYWGFNNKNIIQNCIIYKQMNYSIFEYLSAKWETRGLPSFPYWNTRRKSKQVRQRYSSQPLRVLAIKPSVLKTLFVNSINLKSRHQIWPSSCTWCSNQTGRNFNYLLFLTFLRRLTKIKGK